MRIGSKAVACVLAVLAVSSCVRFEPKPLAPEKSVTTFQERSLADPSLRQYIETNLGRTFPSWPPPEWDLETFTFAAFYFSPDLATARAKFETVAAGKVTAGQSPNPTINVYPAYNTTTAIPSPWLVTATLDIPIETAGKRGYRLAQAQHRADAAGFALVAAAWDVRFRLRRALLDLWSAQESEALLHNSAVAQEKIVGLLEKELSAGAVSPAEVAGERIALEQTRLASLDAASHRAQAMTQIATVIGVPPQTLADAAISFHVFNQPPIDIPAAEARRRAVVSRSDVLSALADYAATESALQLEIARQYPDIHLNPGYEFDQGANKWGIGFNIELPILNRNRGPIAEAEAQRREAGVKFEALQARVFGEVENALAGCDNARKKFATAAAISEQSQLRERTAQNQFKAGEISRQMLVTAQRESATIGLAQLDARLKVQQALALLESALQNPIDPSMKRIPSAVTSQQTSANNQKPATGKARQP